MAKTKKMITDLQKQILNIRCETEEKYAEKAATEEKINRLSFTLALFQAEKTMDESILEKIDGLKEQIAALESQVRQMPRAIRKLEAKHRQLQATERSAQ
jgi:hypothetical protein